MGDTDGPAPGVYDQFDPVEAKVEPYEGGETREAQFQPWVGSGAVYVAWRIGAETGRLGTFETNGENDIEGGTVCLGESGYPAGAGRYRRAVDLDADTASRIHGEAWRGKKATQSPSASARPAEEVDDLPVDPDRIERVPDPAPPDAAATGERHTYHLRWWNPDAVGVCQPWRPVDGGPVFVACETLPSAAFVDTSNVVVDRCEYAVFDGTTVRLGRRPGLRWVYYLHDETGEAFDSLAADVRELREPVESGFRTV